MNFAALSIHRPVATVLITLGITLAGGTAYFLLPVSPLPQVDFPTISMRAVMPGASPETMATSVATPLERHLGQIADVSEMTSLSSVSSSRITLQFGLDRDIDGAARDVQAAISAARADLPTSLRSNPTYRKVNPADSPIMIIAMTSPVLTSGQIYDSAATVVQQKLSQVKGVGLVNVSGASLPAVRVELNPRAMFKYGIGLEDVRAALASANANAPKGAIEDGTNHFQISTNDQAGKAADYRPLIVAYRQGRPVRLTDVGEVLDSTENLRVAGFADGKPAVLVQVLREPGANIIETVDRIKALLPELKASIPQSIDLTPADRTATIRSSLTHVQITLLISLALVILVVFLFLREPTAVLIPAVVVPVSLIGTFGAMYLLGYSLDNLSLMALTVATGFVVDDAIVVLENITRLIEAGMPRRQAALQGAQEVGFTVLSMSLSLIAVFLPILLMGGVIGRLFREFAVTLSVSILVSLVVSLTTTPMMCAYLLRHTPEAKQGWLFHTTERLFQGLARSYGVSLRFALRHRVLTLCVLAVTIICNVYLFIVIPKGFFPQQDTGRLTGNIQGDQSISFQLMSRKLSTFMAIVAADPAVASVVGDTGDDEANSGDMFVALKPLSQRTMTAEQVIARLRGSFADVPGASLVMQAVQDVRIGGRGSRAQYQYSLQADNLTELRRWAPRLVNALRQRTEIVDVNSDQQDKGLETDVVIDRDAAAQLQLSAIQIDNTLYDAFGQRQVSTIYNALNQYHVVMEVAPEYWQSPETLKDLWISTSGGPPKGTQTTNAVAGTAIANTKKLAANAASGVAADSARNAANNALAVSGHGSGSSGAAVSAAAEKMVPLAAIARYQPGTTPLAINHQGHFAAITLSFNLAPGHSLSDAVTAVAQAESKIGMPVGVHGAFAGTARTFQQSLDNQPLLIGAALLAVYIVLGILYESLIHPLTILSTLPSAGIGAVLALMVCNTEFSLIALIGVILLIGIVKKNAIMMVDFALDAQKKRGLSAMDAIYEACLMRFRPILMTTAVALFGALPLAVGRGDGAELRQPLGISILGGLIVSQVLTLYTTPVIFLYMERLRVRALNRG